jgi:hypothetical protein
MELEEKIRTFEARRNALLDQLSEIDPEVLSARPEGDKWSPIEIVEHMVVAEREVFLGLPEYADLKVYTRNFKNKVMLRIVMLVLGRIKVKVPSPTMNPKGGADLADLKARWDESQQWFRDYVESCDGARLNNAVFKHPVSGPINVEQVIDLGIAHLNAHTNQIRSLLGA